MRFLVYAVLFSWILFSCSQVTQETREIPSVSYDMKTFRVSSSPGCKADTCAFFEMKYPEFIGMDTTLAKKLKREIDLSFSLGDPEAEDKTINQVASEFINAFKQFKKEFGDRQVGWFYKGNARVNVLTDSLLSISLDQESYTGGAHGSATRHFINVNPRTGKKIEVSDILKAGFENTLLQSAEKAFRNAREMSDSSTYRFNDIQFPEGKFQLNDNFGFAPDGIIYYWNPYEITSYAQGPTEIFIPYEEIKDWLKK